MENKNTSKLRKIVIKYEGLEEHNSFQDLSRNFKINFLKKFENKNKSNASDNLNQIHSEKMASSENLCQNKSSKIKDKEYINLFKIPNKFIEAYNYIKKISETVNFETLRSENIKQEKVNNKALFKFQILVLCVISQKTKYNLSYKAWDKLRKLELTVDSMIKLVKKNLKIYYWE